MPKFERIAYKIKIGTDTTLTLDLAMIHSYVDVFIDCGLAKIEISNIDVSEKKYKEVLSFDKERRQIIELTLK